MMDASRIRNLVILNLLATAVNLIFLLPVIGNLEKQGLRADKEGIRVVQERKTGFAYTQIWSMNRSQPRSFYIGGEKNRFAKLLTVSIDYSKLFLQSIASMVITTLVYLVLLGILDKAKEYKQRENAANNNDN